MHNGQADDRQSGVEINERRVVHVLLAIEDRDFLLSPAHQSQHAHGIAHELSLSILAEEAHLILIFFDADAHQLGAHQCLQVLLCDPHQLSKWHLAFREEVQTILTKLKCV
jgi:hypothetical protein